MSLSWTGKIRSAFEGMADATDARARLAAGASLAGFRQQLADRQLEAQIANIQEPWRVPFVLAPIAAPLWLADALVSLAQSLQEAEEADHPDRPTVMTSLTHGQMLALLEPVDALAADIAGVLADPRHRPSVSLPLLARPYSHDGAGLTTEYVPLPYVRGLLSGTTSITGATQLLLADYSAFLGHPQAPAWLVRAFTTAQGDLAALQTRLDAVQGRSGPVLRQHPADVAALRDLALSLWSLANAALALGQRLASPMLFEGAQPLPPTTPVPGQHAAPAGSSTPSPAGAQQAPPVAMPAPVSPTPPEPRHDSPAAPPTVPTPVVSPARPPAKVEARIAPMPEIGIAPREDPAISRLPTPPPDQPRPLPQIGGLSSEAVSPHTASQAPTTAVPPTSPAQSPPRPVDRKDRWLLSSRSARYRLRAADQEEQAEAHLRAFWDARHWSLSQEERRYLDEVRQLVTSGGIIPSGSSQPDAPFAPIYKVSTGAVKVLEHTLKLGTLFSYDYQAGGRGLLTDLSPQAGVPDNP